MPVSIRFTPTSEKEVNFNVICNIKKKTLPLTLNVKAEGYSMNCMVMCEDSNGVKQELNPHGINEINFGDVSFCCINITVPLLQNIEKYSVQVEIFWGE